MEILAGLMVVAGVWLLVLIAGWLERLFDRGGKK